MSSTPSTPDMAKDVGPLGAGIGALFGILLLIAVSSWMLYIYYKYVRRPTTVTRTRKGGSTDQKSDVEVGVVEDESPSRPRISNAPSPHHSSEPAQREPKASVAMSVMTSGALAARASSATSSPPRNKQPVTMALEDEDE